MNNKMILMVIVAIILGILVLKEICGKVVEGQQSIAESQVEAAADLVIDMLAQNDGTNIGITTLVDDQGRRIAPPAINFDIDGTILRNGCIIPRLAAQIQFTGEANNDNWNGNICSVGDKDKVRVDRVSSNTESNSAVNFNYGQQYCENNCIPTPTRPAILSICQNCCQQDR